MNSLRRSHGILSIATASLLLATACSPESPKGPGSPKDPSRSHDEPIRVAELARAGAVDGTTQNSDEFIWRLFVGFVSPASPANAKPVVFETWASDLDTFSTTPQWPAEGAPKRLQASALQSAVSHFRGPIDVKYKPPGNAAVGGFPTTPVIDDQGPWIAEEVRRNRPMFDYIVDNGLNTKAGLKSAFERKLQVKMPTEAVAVKGDWVPVQTLLQWIPQIGGLERLRELYYTGTSDSVEYALVSLHVSSRANANWVWGTFEHYLSPGRADDIGSWDTFGAVTPRTMPNRQELNTQYGPCHKTEPLLALMREARLSPVWQNYCLKSTQVDFTAQDGTPTVLGNSVVERIVGNGTVAISSCISCHYYASFGPDGSATAAATNMLPYNPAGKVLPAVLDGAVQFDFMWGVLLAP